MRRCTICHTGIYTYGNGILKDNKVYLLGDDDNLYLPEEMFMAREECEGGFIQFEVEGKWGFVSIIEIRNGHIMGSMLLSIKKEDV